MRAIAASECTSGFALFVTRKRLYPAHVQSPWAAKAFIMRRLREIVDGRRLGRQTLDSERMQNLFAGKTVGLCLFCALQTSVCFL